MTEEVHVCPVAATLSAAVPYTALADVKDKQRVSVWPRSSFNSGSEGSIALPAPAAAKPTAPAPAPAPPSVVPTDARELARERARQSNASPSPAVLAARERAKAQFAAKKAAAGES